MRLSGYLKGHGTMGNIVITPLKSKELGGKYDCFGARCAICLSGRRSSRPNDGEYVAG
jgi:hypothetical protein